MEQPLALEGTREELARSYRERGWWLPERLTDHVRRWAATRADALALVDESERLTWADLWGRTVATADALGEPWGSATSSRRSCRTGCRS